MNANEIAAKINAKYPELEAEANRRGVSVYGFSRLGQRASEARSWLESMGFVLSANSGALRIQAPEPPMSNPQMTLAQKLYVLSNPDHGFLAQECIRELQELGLVAADGYAITEAGYKILRDAEEARNGKRR